MRPQGPIIVLACAVGVMAAQVLWAGHAPARAAGGDLQMELVEFSGLATFETAAGGPIEDLREPATPERRGVFNAQLIERIQDGLARQGFYLGPIDGLFGPRTEAAIRAYQKSADLPVDGRPSEQLAIDLETGGKVGELLGRLEKSRATATQNARAALLARPETRALIEGADDGADDGANEGAAQALDKALDKTLDQQACMASPTPRCLLADAAESARNIEKPEMRDWALGEILTSQARAGLAQEALATTRRIHDPRLIMVALRDIAMAQAEAGQTEDALAAVDIIPDQVLQVEAYVAIAEIQANRGHAAEAAQTARHLLDYLNGLAAPLTKLTFRTRIAVILHKAGQSAQADEFLTAADALLNGIADADERAEGQRYIAAALAENGKPAQAMEVLKGVESGAHDVPVLIAAATKQAQFGEDAEALITAEAIEAVRYRALVLARIASYQAGAGNLDKARTTLDKALEAAKQIKFPFAKAYAFSRIALALNDVGISAGNDAAFLDEALEAAHLIKDDRLRAHIFWTIADERRRAADADGAALAQTEADKAADDIISPFSRVWMLCDIAEERARRGELDAAWEVFRTALDEARTITHPWGRARALGKVAGTMTTLAYQGTETATR